MFVTPAPVRLLIVFFQPGKRGVLAMVFFGIHAIRPILMRIPFMIVVVLSVVVDDLVIVGSQHCGRQCYRGDKSGTQQGGIPETGHDYFHVLHQSRCVANDLCGQ